MRQQTNTPGRNLKSRTLGLALAAVLIPGGLAMAHGHDDYGPAMLAAALSGHVDIVHQIPGGIISVGIGIGRPRPEVVEQRREVVEVEQPRRCDREVTVIHEEPRREVTVIRTEGRDENRHDRGFRREDDEAFQGHKHGRGGYKYHEEERRVSYQRDDHDGREQDYRDANRDSYQRNDRGGEYNHYEYGK